MIHSDGGLNNFKRTVFFLSQGVKQIASEFEIFCLGSPFTRLLGWNRRCFRRFLAAGYICVTISECKRVEMVILGCLPSHTSRLIFVTSLVLQYVVVAQLLLIHIPLTIKLHWKLGYSISCFRSSIHGMVMRRYDQV